MKTFEIIVIFLAMCGMFMFGRLSVDKISKKVEISETLKSSNSISQVSTQADTEKDSTRSQQTVFVEKFYSPKGKLIKETESKSIYGANIVSSTHSSALNDISTQQVSDIKSSTITDYRSNWGLGISTPLKFQIPESVNTMLLYRAIGNLYVTGSINVELKEINISSNIGLIYLF